MPMKALADLCGGLKASCNRLKICAKRIASRQPSRGVFDGRLVCRKRMKLCCFAWTEDFHVMPIVRQFLTAIEANHIDSSGQRSLGSWPLRAAGHGKTVMLMRAPKKQIQDHCVRTSFSW